MDSRCALQKLLTQVCYALQVASPICEKPKIPQTLPEAFIDRLRTLL